MKISLLFLCVFSFLSLEATRYSRMSRLLGTVAQLIKENNEKTRQLIILESDLRNTKKELDVTQKAFITFQKETQITFYEIQQAHFRELVLRRQGLEQFRIFKK